MTMTTPSEAAAAAYIDLIKKVLTRFVAQDEFAELIYNRQSWQARVFSPIKALLARKQYVICRRQPFDAHERTHGLDWPPSAETMVGMRCLDNIEYRVRQVLANGIRGAAKWTWLPR